MNKPYRTLHKYNENDKLIKFDNFFRRLSISNSELTQYLVELNNSEFHQQLIDLKSKYKQNNTVPGHANYGKINDYCLGIIYALIRRLKPMNVVETGVGFGTSSSIILEALQQNQSGRLTSIDPDLTADTGILVQNKTYWHWQKDYSINALPEINDNIDIFIHDSDHSYKNMLFEFNCAFTKMKKGIILSHDIGRNDAFFDFAKSKNLDFYLLPKYKNNFKRYSVGAILVNYDANDAFIFNDNLVQELLLFI